MSKDTKIRALLIIKYLWENTDLSHTVSIVDIQNALKEQEIDATRHTVMSDIERLVNSGIDIICQREVQNRYSIGERIFELPELKLMIDAVEAARFISQDKSEKLIEKLSTLASKYEAPQLVRNIDVYKRTKSENARLYYNIDLANQAINEGKKIEFQYFIYSPYKEKQLKNNGEVYTLSPHRITWSNDCYYLVGYSEKHNDEVVFRVDRITNTRITDDQALVIPQDFDMPNFLKSTFLMYDGQSERVTLLCDKAMMNNVIDKFGEDVETQYDADYDPDHFKALVDVSVGPTFFSWIFNYRGKIRIIHPQSVVAGFDEMVNIFVKKQGNS